MCDLTNAMRENLHVDNHMAAHLWVLIFPIVWATLEKQQQVRGKHGRWDMQPKRRDKGSAAKLRHRCLTPHGNQPRPRS